MDLISIKTIYGPNVYHADPVIIMKINLGDLVDTPSKNIPNFNRRLKETFPGLYEHTCSEDVMGGFYLRLDLGTYLGHIIEHIAIELSQLVEIPVCYGKTRFTGEPGCYNVIVRFTHEEGMIECLKVAFRYAECLINNKEFDLDSELENIKSVIEKNQLGPSTQSILDAAVKRKIPYRRLGKGTSLFQLGYGKNRRFFQASASDRTSLIASDIVQDKYLTKTILSRYLIPTPSGILIETKEELKTVSDHVKPPYAVKPFDGNQGKGVSLNIRCPLELENVFEYAKKYSEKVLIEEMCIGNDYRLLVIAGRLIACAERKPPIAVGDGSSTILQLIDVLNSDPRRADGHAGYLTKVVIDESLIHFLAKQNLKLQSVPEKNMPIALRGNANLSSGGTANDVTKRVHPEIKNLCERAARLLNLDICGIDLVHKEISLPINDQTKVIEVNAAPGLRMHRTAADGTQRDIGAEIMNLIYPAGQDYLIPIIAVTGTNGKTTVSRIIQKILSVNHSNVGLTTTEGIWIGSDKIVSGDTTGPLSAEAVLSDPKIDYAVLEVARGGLVRGGLAYDWSDVGIVTNIRADHIGQDGIESIDDLIRIKSLIAERVRESGTLVLNADDAASLSIKDRPQVKAIPKNLFLYSIDKNNSEFIKHIEAGGNGCWLDGHDIFLRNKHQTERLISTKEIPMTFDGVVDFQISNVLAAVAACVGLGIQKSVIVAGLQEFNPIQSNPGRLSLYKVRNNYVIVDYGHNPDAIAAVCHLVQCWSGYKTTAVFGLPGDRGGIL